VIVLGRRQIVVMPVGRGAYQLRDLFRVLATVRPMVIEG
jgi:hypothetical protein